MQTNIIELEQRVAPGMHIGNFDRNLYTSRKFVSKVVDITLDLAREFLERAGPLVSHSKVRIATCATTMAADKWKLTHQGIGFNWDGKLVDGYTRLQAIISSGRTQPMQVTFGLDPDDYPAIDTGFARRGKHMLRIAGQTPVIADASASSIRLYLRYTQSLRENKLVSTAPFTPQVIHDFHVEHEDFAQVVEEVLSARQPWREVMSPAVAITLVYMATKKHHSLDVVMAFIKGIGSFVNQDDRHPILVLYKSLHKEKKGGHKPEEALAKAIRTFNKWVRFGKMSMVQGIGIIRSDQIEDGDVPEDTLKLPTIVGYMANHHRDINRLD